LVGWEGGRPERIWEDGRPERTVLVGW